MRRTEMYIAARSQNCEKRLLASSNLSVYPSVRKERLGSHWMDFHEIYIRVFFFENLSRKSEVSLKSDKITDTLHEDNYVHVHICLSSI